MLGSLPQNNPEFCSFEKWNQVMISAYRDICCNLLLDFLLVIAYYDWVRLYGQ